MLADDSQISGSADPARSSQPDMALAHVPTLALLATLCFVSAKILHYIMVPVWAVQSGQVSIPMLAAGRYATNCAGIAGCITLASCLTQFTLDREFSHKGRRALVAFLGAIVFLSMAGAVLARPEQYGLRSVLLAAGATHMVVVQAGLGTLRTARSLNTRMVALLVCIGSLLSLLPLVLATLTRSPALVQMTQRASDLVEVDAWMLGLLDTTHALGEVSFLLMPLCVSFAVLPWGEHRRARQARRIGALTAFGCGILLVTGKLPGDTQLHLVYAALHLKWVIAQLSIAYAVPVTLIVGAATAALLSQDANQRQAGMGLCLWLVAGYNPLTPFGLLSACLAALLICRAMVAITRVSHSAPDVTRRTEASRASSLPPEQGAP